MYYIIINNEKAGPMSIQQLLAAGLNPNSMVWKQGMPNWAPASQLPELMEAITVGAGQNAWQQQQPQQPQNDWQHQQQQPQQNTWQQPQQPEAYQSGYVPSNLSTWNTWAIIATILGLCSCIGLVLGILGIVNINKAKTAFLTGNAARGEGLLSTGRTLTITSLVFAGIGIICNIIYFFIILGAAAL